jgi:proline racemase
VNPSYDVRTVDYHTAGEPFRIVVSGGPEIPGDSVLARREAAADGEGDALRRLLCHEPRGHADMYGCFLVPPDDHGAHLGVLFWHKDGFSTACGHGTIALGAWAVESGRVAANPDGETEVVLDVPSGRVSARVRCSGGAVQTVTFRNIPSWIVARGLPVSTSFGDALVDVAYGGALYACLPASALGLELAPERLPDLVCADREVKAALAGSPATRQAPDPRLSGIYGTTLFEALPDIDGGPHQRNVTVFADGEVDRSPCGSGTSARLALLAADGLLDGGRVLTHDSLIGTRFLGRVVKQVRVGGRPAVITEVEGAAFRTGEHRFLLDPRDPLGSGFVLR